jgi:hypothetical protein
MTGYIVAELTRKPTSIFYASHEEYHRVVREINSPQPGGEQKFVKTRCRFKDGTFIDMLPGAARPANLRD